MTQHFNPKRGKLKSSILEKGSIFHKMKGSTKLEREMYEQFIIVEKYGGEISKKGSQLNYLLNKVNPVGGRFKLDVPIGEKEFYEAANKVIEKYSLPSVF